MWFEDPNFICETSCSVSSGITCLLESLEPTIKLRQSPIDSFAPETNQNADPEASPAFSYLRFSSSSGFFYLKGGFFVSYMIFYMFQCHELPVQVRCTILDAWGWCTGTTQRDGMGREEGEGFRMGNTCIPVADSFWYLAKLIQLCKI